MREFDIRTQIFIMLVPELLALIIDLHAIHRIREYVMVQSAFNKQNNTQKTPQKWNTWSNWSMMSLNTF